MYQSRANAYKTVGVQSASPERILDEVFQRIRVDCQRALSALESNDVDTRCKQISHAIKLVDALESSLDTALAPELCENLVSLYGYVRRRLFDANANADKGAIEEAMELIGEVHTSFQSARKAA
ncbi:MAG: flagellar export chaperone FliS [Nannocystaceae bacterium]|nr:flagellar export chaperone FliS [bacterium]